MAKNFVNLVKLNNPLKIKQITVPGIGTLAIRQMNAKQMLRLQEKTTELNQGKELSDKGKLELGIILLAFSLCDEEGNLSYSEETANDILNMPFETLQVLMEKLTPEISKLNGMAEVKKTSPNEVLSTNLPLN